MDSSNNEREQTRGKKIIRTSIVGIVANVLLAAFKAAMGLLSNSIAITLDAVNNISDAASSVITIIGTKLASKSPDKKHPFGYGRIEYLSAMVIALIVLYAGITSLVESIKKILSPETPEYTTVILIIIAIAVIVKIVLGHYVKSIGQQTNSESLINSGEDARLDAIISASTLLAAIVYLAWGIQLEAWLGAIISLVIIKSGIEMIWSTLSKILGENVGVELAQAVKETVRSYPGVIGVYDLVLNNYGPDKFNGSVHVEIPDNYSAPAIDSLTRGITEIVYEKHGIILTGISIYSVNSSDEQVVQMRNAIQEVIDECPYILEMHAFALQEEKKAARLDLVVSLDAPNRAEAFKEALGKIEERCPGYNFQAVMDTDFAEA